MAGKRSVKIEPGKSIILYIPKKIEPEIIDWMNQQSQLSPSIFEMIRLGLERGNASENGISQIADLIAQKIINDAGSLTKVRDINAKKSSKGRLSNDQRDMLLIKPDI